MYKERGRRYLTQSKQEIRTSHLQLIFTESKNRYPTSPLKFHYLRLSSGEGADRHNKRSEITHIESTSFYPSWHEEVGEDGVSTY